MRGNAIHIFLFCLALLCNACVERDKNGKVLDNPTSGSVKIAVDESLRPLLETEVDTFEGTYTYASINVTFTSENEAIEALMKDSVRLAVITRKLNKDEADVFAKLKLIPTQTKVAKEAVAIILNQDNPDSIFQFSQLQDMMRGKVTQWKQLNPASKLSTLDVVFDNPQSGIVRYLKDSVAHVDKLPGNFYAVKNNKEVVDYVSQKPNALGLIGVSWISDRDDATASKFLRTIRVARVSRGGAAVQPNQAYIANRQYPLCRDVYVISREARMGLGTGFTAFVAGDKGQRIVLKSGMVPATVPVRLVHITRSPIQ
jgi:phosphate transport system substrate-binding protein